MTHELSPATSLDHLRKQAKRWLRQFRRGDAEARTRFESAHPNGPAAPGLRDVQHALAREYGHESWIALKAALARTTGEDAARGWPTFTNEQYEAMASDLVAAFNDSDEDAMRRLNARYGRDFDFDDLGAEIWRRVYAFRQRSFRGADNFLQLDEAQGIIAQDAGFGSWEGLIAAPQKRAARVPPYAIDGDHERIAPRRQLSAAEWDELIGVMRERRIPALDGNGLLSDEVLERLAGLDHLRALSLAGSRRLTDKGLRHVANLPQLQHLNLSGYPGGHLTDRGLEVLRHLPNLRGFEMTWQRGVSDLGVANLRACERLESVNLMGSTTGDGAIEALQGKAALRRFSSGKQVTDDGLALLHGLPLFTEEPAGDVRTADGVTQDHDGASLLIDGPFTDDGLAGLAGLAGVVKLDLFWHVKQVSGSGFAHLAEMPTLTALGADGALTNDVAMRHIAAIPRLRGLRAQESAATDDGFEALARSRTLEYLWGRVCEGFGSRGFVALSKMPKLRAFGIGCANVDDAALATLPRFPALRELTPIGVSDGGFRHIGECTKLERLTCMYCRDTGDAATEHIAGLALSYYYAGLTQITDRSLQILGRMDSLEQIDLCECNGPTDAGLAFLAGLPRLREVNLDGCPGLTLAGTRVFPASVRVRYST